MSFNFGNNIKITIFGQSHSDAIGVVIDGLPTGFEIDMDHILNFMSRRKSTNKSISTARSESDTPKILSGLVDGKTCGSPICAIIENHDTRSKDYEKLKSIPRPSHADYPAFIKYDGYNDVRGGGHFSGRMTAPLCFAGAVCIQILESKGIKIGAHILSIANIKDNKFDSINSTKDQLQNITQKEFATINDDKAKEMQDKIISAKQNCDSVGGIIECCVLGIDCGVGEPIFDSIESKISSAIFSIPAVKGIEFGNGFDACNLFGSQNNDEYYFDEGNVKTKTNNAGGIVGGLTTGMPIIFRAGFKPTPSISKQQNSIDLITVKNTKLNIQGRHDPCIVPRAVPCVEAMTAIALADFIL